ncbi:MAG: hypothetical protein OSA52_06270 [Yoonia sp.]|nr:hypothetical protein [Yoonia sp.]
MSGCERAKHQTHIIEDGMTEEAKLTFIASRATFVSHSYHGVFWGLFMGPRTMRALM